ncbi:MAG TPA: cation:proton antiporter [Anaerolineales bacterium]|nr:cation:proton antiporter [Anaerolineales bacterium]
MPHLPTLLVQIGVILVASRAVGFLFRKIHQPQVMGEMVAGILLGPSLLGWAAPGIFNTVFPSESLGYLNSLSQIGLLLFMFLVGLELDPKILRGRGRTAFVTSNVSIIVPFSLGILLAYFLYPRLSDDSVSFTGFALFLGTAMSITAFPVLARILTERNLLRTPLGTVAIASAAVNDVTGWIILAGVVLVVRATGATIPLWLTLTGTVLYVLVMFLLIRPGFQKLEVLFEKRGRINQNMLALILFLVLVSALTTEWLGIHALFGAFLAGAIMPKKYRFVHALAEKLNDAAVVLLLPIFFAFTGLRTSIGLVNGAEMWFYCGLIILVAIAGKFGGATLSARFTGMSWREAGALGILMNTRGLMELVLLNIGLDIGVISPSLFAMMVLMALVTTFMTSPILEWVYFRRMLPNEESVSEVAEGFPELGAAE